MKSSTGTDAIPYEIVPTDTLDRDFDRLLAANGPALGRLAASYTNTLSDRDDLLQEIVLAVWQALRTFRGECSERTFLFRIAHNRAIAYLSRTRSQVSETVDELEVHDPAPPTPNRDSHKNSGPNACGAPFTHCPSFTAKSPH
jgi:RNA polymerase sigma factor (sigma-70 family)